MSHRHLYRERCSLFRLILLARSNEMMSFSMGGAFPRDRPAAHRCHEILESQRKKLFHHCTAEGLIATDLMANDCAFRCGKFDCPPRSRRIAMADSPRTPS